MTALEVLRQLAVGFGVVIVTGALCWVIVNVLYGVEGVVRYVVGRARCLAGRHGWITVTFSYHGYDRPGTRYRVCSTCRRREDLVTGVS